MARKPDNEETKRLKASLREEPEDIDYENVEDDDENNPSEDQGDSKETEVEESEVEEVSDKTSNKKLFNPLEGSPKSADREYTKSASSDLDEVDEAYTQPSSGDDEDGEGSTEPKGLDPEISKLSPDEQRLASESAFDIAVTGYKMLFQLAQKGVRIKDSKLNELSKEINLYVPISITDENGEVHLMPFKDVVGIFNKNVDSGLTYSQEFIDSVREPVIKKFMEKNIGLSDNNKLWYLCILELARIGMTMYSLNAMKLDFFSEAKDKSKSTTPQMQQQAPQGQTQQQPPQQSQPQQVEIVETQIEEEPIREEEEKNEKENEPKIEI